MYEGPRNREYPMPPLRSTGFTDHMVEAAKQLGWKPFRPPAAINSEKHRGRPAFVFHGYLQPGRAPHLVSRTRRRSPPPFREAMKTKNLTVFDRARVMRIAAGSDGRVTGVHYLRDGK